MDEPIITDHDGHEIRGIPKVCVEALTPDWGPELDGWKREWVEQMKLKHGENLESMTMTCNPSPLHEKQVTYMLEANLYLEGE